MHIDSLSIQIVHGKSDIWIYWLMFYTFNEKQFLNKNAVTKNVIKFTIGTIIAYTICRDNMMNEHSMYESN